MSPLTKLRVSPLTLRENGVEAELPGLIERARALSSPDAGLDWTAWLQESRDLLRSQVYDESILSAVRRAERRDENLSPLNLGDDYRLRMQELTRNQLAVAGLRIAAYLSRHTIR